MAIASFAARTTTFTTTTAACFELRAAASVRPKLLEMSIIQATGTACSYGLGRPQAIGVTPTSPQTMLRDDPNDAAATSQVALAWATSPTVPLNYHRRWNSAATVGVGIVWTFPRGLVIPASGSLVIWNISTTVACDVNAVVDE